MDAMKDGEVVLLESVRFHKEEQITIRVAKKLASLADIFVLDAFGTSHRAHASTVGVASYIRRCRPSVQRSWKSWATQ